ncbi:MAG TPA: sugar phosphate nucleotidyltransferase, partial [Patescibacteria group bacterium]|nr:sugar phosphate nucleotidyltransferase [Patescibacteria group bacterium]
MNARKITPVILSGGAGTRLWPLSREHFPKQLLALSGPRSMLEETLQRFADVTRFTPPLIITNEALRFPVAEQLLHSGITGGSIVLEPVARNTAPAVAAAALMAVAADPEAMILVVASDHVIGDVPGFLNRVQAALPAAQAGRSLAERQTDPQFVRLGAEAFAASPKISVDYAVMEHTDRAATIPCDIGWADVGSWGELWAIADKDADGNVVIGDGMAERARNCYIRSDHKLVAVLGIDDLVVISTDDAVLVMPRQRSQDTRLVVDRLRDAKRSELTSHSRVLRPWGSYQSIQTGERFQVKQLTINPGGKLSLQMHYHRAEHWVVVNGTALVTRDDQTLMLRENESIYIPAGAMHRLENPGKVPLNLIEVQSGGYLGEDDIVRVDDVYGRVA